MTYKVLPSLYRDAQLHFMVGQNDAEKEAFVSYMLNKDANATCIRLQTLIEKNEDPVISALTEDTLPDEAAVVLLGMEIKRVISENHKAIIILDGCIRNPQQFEKLIHFFLPIIQTVFCFPISEEVYLQNMKNEQNDTVVVMDNGRYNTLQQRFCIYAVYLAKIKKICNEKSILFKEFEATQDIDHMKEAFVKHFSYM